MDKREDLIVPIDRTNGVGLPCVWEEGGGTRVNGEALVIGDGAGKPKVPYTIRNGFNNKNGRHALIPLDAGDILVKAFRKGNVYEIIVGRADTIESETGISGKPIEMALCKVAHYYNGSYWSPPLPSHLNNIVQQAKRKAAMYHCRRPVFYREKTTIESLEESDVLEDDGLPL